MGQTVSTDEIDQMMLSVLKRMLSLMKDEWIVAVQAVKNLSL
jgi:hypothetical protein